MDSSIGLNKISPPLKKNTIAILFLFFLSEALNKTFNTEKKNVDHQSFFNPLFLSFCCSFWLSTIFNRISGCLAQLLLSNVISLTVPVGVNLSVWGCLSQFVSADLSGHTLSLAPDTEISNSATKLSDC